MLSTDDLFESGRSVLTPVGQTRLDEIVAGANLRDVPRSQIVIAAYTDDLNNRERRRNPDAGAGRLGSQIPGRNTRSSRRAGSSLARSLPWVLARTLPHPSTRRRQRTIARVEVILFTPQT